VSVDRIPWLPLGELHPYGRCWWCGATASRARLHRTTLPATFAEAMICDDGCACARRRYRLRFGQRSSQTRGGKA
jgi:hypothetical protein